MTRDDQGDLPTVPDVPGLPHDAADPSGQARVDPDRVSVDVTADNRYQPRRQLGRGGMGEVTLCRDLFIGRDIAIKRMTPQISSRSSVRARFLREARVQAQLEHPSIVPVYEVGQDPDGTPWFGMKRVRGVSLRAVLRELAAEEAGAAEKWTRRRLLHAFAQVCLAIDYAHELGVIHRDLKPDNIMLGDYGEVYVLDWGIARVEDAPSIDSSQEIEVDASELLTEAGALLGTPGYMAPEQVRGRTADRRADVYALGAILFEILTCEPLAVADTPNAVLLLTLEGFDAHASERVPAAEVPPELELLCVDATALDRGERIATARVLQTRLQRYLDGDRDLALRRSLAEDHRRAAQTAADRVLAGEEEARATALGEIGRALALDPSRSEAMSILVTLLENPPQQSPPEVEARLSDRANTHNQTLGRLGAAAYGLFLMGIPLTLAMGVRNWTAYAIGLSAILSALALCGFIASRGTVARGVHIALGIVGCVGVGGMSMFFGPYIAVPAVAVAHTAVLCSAMRPDARIASTVLGVLMVIVPVALGWLGVVPEAYSFTSDGVLVHSFAIHFPELPSHIFLLFTSVGPIVTIGIVVSMVFRRMVAAERRLELLAWQLRGLLERTSLMPS